VLDDHRRARAQVGDQGDRGVEVEDVVERQRLPLDRPRGPDRAFGRGLLPVERGVLVRVLAVDDVESLRQVEPQALRDRVVLSQEAGDRGVVRGGRAESLRREPPPQVARQHAPRPQLGEHLVVVRRIDEDADVFPVLPRRAHHRRAADVDHLDDLLERLRRIGGGARERVEVHDDEVDRRDVVRGEIAHVRRVAPDR
jgi:hypothetical protein